MIEKGDRSVKKRSANIQKKNSSEGCHPFFSLEVVCHLSAQLALCKFLFEPSASQSFLEEQIYLAEDFITALQLIKEC